MSRALARGLLVIETLAGADEQGLGPTAVAEAAEIDKATASRILQTLIDTGYVVHDDVTRRYRLTGKIRNLAQGVGDQLDLRAVARPHLRRLNEELNETVHLGVMHGDHIVYLDKLESTNSIQLVSAIGQWMPLHSTSLGKSMLAELPDEELEDVLATIDFTPRTERTITNVEDFRRAIDKTRADGYSTDDRENEPAGACVAAAVVDFDGRPVGAISISGPEFRIRHRFVELGEAVREAARAIGQELGAR